MIRCPCCEGRGEIEPGPPTRLTRGQRAIYDAVRSSRHGLPSSRLVSLVYAEDIDGGPNNATKTLHAQVFQMNKRLRPFGERMKSEGGFYKLFHLTTTYHGERQWLIRNAL